MSANTCDVRKLEVYERKAKELWGKTKQWTEFEQKTVMQSAEERLAMGEELLALFVPFGTMADKGVDPASDAAQKQAALIQQYISEHFYTCTNEIFAQLGRVYASGGEFTKNINAAAGAGAAEFASRAIELYCQST